MTNETSTKSTSTLPDHILKGALAAWSHTGEQHFIPISGCSMLPLIRNGDQALVAHGVAGVRQGDVVVFRQEGQLVAHRVLRIVRKPHRVPTLTTFLIKGDNNLQVDPLVQGDEIVGRVVLIKRGEATIAVDTFAWRVAGRCIALGTLARLQLYRRGAPLKRRLLGTQANFATRAIRRSMLTGSSLMLSLVNRLLSGH